jgi:hypothetical protein
MSGRAEGPDPLDWSGPPPGWIGGLLPTVLVVARNEAAAIMVEDVAVYPTGIGFTLRALMRPADGERIRSGSPSERVAFGVEFDDGRRAERFEPVGGPGDFSFIAHYEGKDVAPDPSVNVLLGMSGGSSSPGSIKERRFIWPLPPGDLRLFGSWPDADLTEQSIDLSADLIAAARARARDVFGAPS